VGSNTTACVACGFERRSDVLKVFKTASRCPDLFERRREKNRGRILHPPPVGILQTRGSRLASLGGQFIFIFGQKGKGFINKGKRNFFKTICDT